MAVISAGKNIEVKESYFNPTLPNLEHGTISQSDNNILHGFTKYT